MLKRIWDRYSTWRNTTGYVIHTIVFARVKLFLGIAYTTLQQSGIDVSSYIVDKKWHIAVQLFFAWLAVDGTLTEWYRRRNADDISGTPAVTIPPDPKRGAM